MKFKNKYTNKIIASGLVGSLLLSSNPFNSFASINNTDNNISVINTENESVEEISPQMLAVLSSLAVASGITITTDDDLYDLGRLFYDYIDRHNDLTWETVNAAFASVSVLQPSNLISVKSDFLDIVKGFFDDTFLNKGNDYPFVGSFDSIPFYPKYITVGEGDTFDCISIIKDGNKLYILINGSKYDFSTTSAGNFNSLHLTYNSSSKEYTLVGGINGVGKYSYGVTSIISSGLVSLPYSGGYAWDDVESKKENDSVSLPVPQNLGTLVGQTSDEFWNNTEGLINPCTQEIILPEIENPSISIGESVEFQTNVNCSVFNEEELVAKAEESKNPTDIKTARDEVNKLPEGQDKEDLQDRLNAIIPIVTLGIKSASANVDIYIKSENMLSLSLSTNSITFDGYSGVEPMELKEAVTLSVSSSLPYDIKAYMPSNISNADGSETIGKQFFNIKESSEDDYQQFIDNTTALILKTDCPSSTEAATHTIDMMLDSNEAYKPDVYKTVIKFEAVQK